MGGKTFIYNGVDPDMSILYSFIISNDGKDVLSYHIGKPNTGIGNIEENKNIIHPATKEQRDLLFQKMYEAGYEWDANKKEPKKIEDEPENYKQQLMSKMTNLVKDYIRQKPSWSEEDEEFLRRAINATKDDYPMTAKWLKSLKDRVQSKQEWNEEDERTYKSITYSFAHNYPLTIQQQEFVKSLKPQNTWKPSNKQIKICKEVYGDILSEKGFDIGTINNELNRLEEELKK